MTDFDVVIVGLGPAGASAAISLAQRGARVLALEAGEFPRHKVCGEFLSPESRATLGRLQVLGALQEAGARPMESVRVFASHGRARRGPRPIEVAMPAPALAVSRWEMDRILATQARRLGVRVETSTRVSHLERGAESWCVRAGGHEWSGKYLLATVGRHAPWWQKDSPAGAAESERFVGLKAHFAGANLEDGVTEMHAWDGGYCGLLRVEGGATNACLLARYESLAGRSPQEFWDALLRERPALRERMGRADLMFPWLATANVCFSPTTPLRRLRNVPGGAQVLGEQVMCAGDAAGFIHPLTGDGMAMALRGGELAAATLVGALQNNWGEGEAQELWARVWEREFASRLRWSRALQATVITPQVSRVAWPAFAALPQMARLAIRKTRGVMA